MRTARGVLLATVLIVAASGVAACSKTPVPVGLAGIGVGDNGQWVGYLQVCSDEIDGANVYIDKGGDTITLGAWTADDPVTGFASWDLLRPEKGWTTALPLTTLADDTEYSMYGRSDSSSTTAGAVHFTMADLAKLSIGEVIYWSGSGDAMVVGTEEEFRADACTTYDE